MANWPFKKRGLGKCTFAIGTLINIDYIHISLSLGLNLWSWSNQFFLNVRSNISPEENI